MTHPRLAVSEMCTYPLPLADELSLWDDLGVRQVGVITAKLDAYGRAKAVAALHERSMVATTVITGAFDLGAPDSWEASRVAMSEAIDVAADIGGTTYFTPGRRVPGMSFDDLTAALAEAVAPCVAHAQARGVAMAIEPSLRSDVSFVHTLRDGLEVAEQAEVSVIADLGNCWAERDYEQTVRRAGTRIAAVQFADAVWGSMGNPPPGGRAVPGDGDLDIAAFVEAALDAGYSGAFELEMVGPLIEAEGHRDALRRGVDRANALLEQVLP